jgi:hypothetical protein
VRKAVALTVTALIVVALGAGTASAATVQVTNSNAAGPGSFKAAIDKANTDSSVGRVLFRFGLAPIVLAQPVVYSGSQSLDILGSGAVIDGGGFVANGGGDLSVTLLTIKNAPKEGLTYEVPPTADGTKKVVLTGVNIKGNTGHGVLINDQEDPEDTGDPDNGIHGNSNGSDAALDVWVTASNFEDNGFSVSDRDGLRVNEGGLGKLNAVITLSRFHHNAADGIELDERADGDAVFTVTGTQLTENGPFDPDDLDDGMDVDELDGGSLIGKVLASVAKNNFEEAWDLNENDGGNFQVDMTLVEASGSGEEGIDFEEDDDFAGGGDLTTTLVGIKADGNTSDDGDAGLKIREKGAGNLTATVRNAQTNGNADDGTNIREDSDGNLVATVDRSTTDGNGGDGIHFDERGANTLTATASNGNSRNNGSAGVRADQGNGTLDLIAMVLTGNAIPFFANASVTVNQTP